MKYRNNMIYIKYIIILFILLLIFYLINSLLKNIDHFNNNIYILPKIIYGYWDDFDNNPIIQSHYENWKKHFGKDWKIIIISKKNINQYVSEHFLKKYENLDATRFSDFLRLELLKNNGGVWLDMGIIITNSNFLNKYYNEMIQYKYDVCLYELKIRTIDPNYPYLENWFIIAPKNSIFINDLYIEFDKSYQMGFLNYKKNVLMYNNVKLDKTIGYHNRTYLMQHAIIHYLIKKGNIYNINIKDASESMFAIHEKENWNHSNIISFILYNNDWSSFYAIKLIKQNRNKIINYESYINKINSM